MTVPELSDVLSDAHVVGLPMRVRFRGITFRETMVLRGPAGWGEFGPFPEYGDEEAATWLASAIEAAWLGPPPAVRDRVPVNATVPAVSAAEVAGVLARFPGARTAKVKVAERGQTLADDVARVRAVRECGLTVRVDANGGWSVDEAVRALQSLGPLEYAEQPCATVEELVEVRRRVPDVRIAADESIRRAEDPLRVARLGGLDVAVVKVAPLGGMRRVLSLAGELAERGIPIVVSSALDSAVGVGAGVAAAAALPSLDFACGLGTGGFFTEDVGTTPGLVDGALAVGAVSVDPARVRRLGVDPERVRWWTERVRRCHAILVDRAV